MPSNRDIPEDEPARKDKSEDTSSAGIPSANEVSRASDQSSSQRFTDMFRDSYTKMHQEIYSDLYRPVSLNAGGNLPDWMKRPGGFPKASAESGKTADGGKTGAVDKPADAIKPVNKPEPAGATAPEARNNNLLSRWSLDNFFKLPKLEINPQPGNPEKKPEQGPPPRPSEPGAPGDHTEPKLPPPPENPGGDKPQPKPETKPDTVPKPEDIAAQGIVTRDGNRVHVDYPGGKRTRDMVLGSDGKAQEIITKDQSGTMHLVKKGDQWYARIQGMELQMPGKIEGNDKGEVTFEMEQGISRREKPDGTTVQEKTNADGSRMSFYNNNQVERLTRKDGSVIDVAADGKTMTETLANSNRKITWTKADDSTWKSDQQPPQQRKNFKVEASGTTSWDGPEGLKFVLRGDGSVNVQGEGSAKIQLDDQNRIKSIDYGKKVREFEYFDNSNEIKKTVIKDTEKNTTSSFTREAAGSDKWKTDNGATWTGDIKVASGGVYSYKPGGSSVQEADKDGRWYTMWADGKVTRDQIGSDGSRLSYENNKLIKALAKDGTNAEISDNKILINNPRTGERSTWTKEGDSWKSDSPRFPGAKKDLQINEKCEVSFVAEDGSRHAIRPDGKEVISRKDGVQLELNDQQQIDRITKGDSVRSIERNPDGSISRITDQGKDIARLVAERKPGDNIKSIEMGADGDITIKRNDNTSTLERANFSSVTRDKDGSPLQLTNQKGDTRNFKWVADGPGKTLAEIQDTKRTSKGDVTETWTRKQGTNDFVSVGANGKEKVRENVQVLPDGSGDYTYKNKDGGKDRVARLGGGDGGDSALSESVEEARESLLDEMRDKLPEANYKRMETMMKNFESRMADRAYLRKLGGVKGAEAIDEEVTKSVQATYDNLRMMVNKGDEGTFYDQKTRVKLAENFMFHAMEPTTIDQGPASNSDNNGHGTCWISSGQIWGMTQHPGAMADYLKSVALDGKYTTKNSGEKDATPITYTFSPKLLSFSGNKQENKWTIESATTEWRDEPGMKTQIWGDRSPVSKIFDYTLPILSGSRREFDVDGGTYETHNFVGQGHTRGTREIMFMVTGDFPVDRSLAGHSDGHLLDNNYNKSMLEKGTVLSYLPGHLRSQTVRKVDNKWYLIQDDQHSEDSDKIMGEITDMEAWARGDKNALKTVNINKIALMHKTPYVGSGDADRIGNVTPRQVSSTTNPNLNNARPNTPTRQYYSSRQPVYRH